MEVRSESFYLFNIVLQYSKSTLVFINCKSKHLCETTKRCFRLSLILYREKWMLVNYWGELKSIELVVSSLLFAWIDFSQPDLPPARDTTSKQNYWYYIRSSTQQQLLDQVSPTA